MPTVNVRQQITTKLETALKGIQVSGGYETNLGNNVYEWQEYPMDTGFFPACTFRDTVVPQKKATGLWDNLLGVEIVLYGNTPAAVRKMVADVIKAIGTQQPKWGGLAYKTDLVDEDTGSEHKDRRIFISKLVINIHFLTAYWSAYQGGD
jgi:hypothetical protein